MWDTPLCYKKKKGEGACLRYVKRRRIWLVSVDRHHILCNEKHIIGIYPKLRFYSNCSYYFFIFFFKLRKNALWAPLLVRLWRTRSTSPNPDVKYKPREGADRGRAERPVTTPESQAEPSGVRRGGFSVPEGVPPNTHRVKAICPTWVSLLYQGESWLEKITENEKCIFYIYATSFFYKRLPCPYPREG